MCKNYKDKQKAKFVEFDQQGTINTDAGQQMETMYASTLQRFEERNKELQQSTFEVGGVKYKDSNQMSRVKEYQQKIADFMQEEVDMDGALFLEQANNLIAMYKNLITNCKEYIADHKHPITASGKARLRLVKGTLSLAQQEYDKFSAGWRELRKEVLRLGGQKQKLVWGNILGIMRGSDFDLDKMEGVGTEGEMTSELQVITSGKKQFYFKEDEKLEEPVDIYRAKYLNDNVNVDEQDLVIYQKLENILKNEKEWEQLYDFAFSRALKYAETEKAENEVFADIQGVLKNFGVNRAYLDFSDRRVQKISKEVLFRFEMWHNRKLACGMAGIDNGESLSKRNVLTSRMAIIMDMPNLMALSNTATLHRGGLQKREGIVMAQAKGVQHLKVIQQAEEGNKKIVYTPEAIRQFSCMQLFDTICGQIDRHEGNRFVSIIEEKDRIIITGVQGIDHDLSFGKLKYADMLSMQSKLPPFIKAEMSEEEEEAVIARSMHIFGQKQKDTVSDSPEKAAELAQKAKCVLPALDKDMVEFLRTIDEKDLQYYLGDLLEGDYMKALWDRLRGIVEAIDRTVEEQPNLLVDKKNWNMEVAKRFADVTSSYIFVSKDNVTEEPKQQPK